MAAMEESFFADTALIGIVCPLPVYRFCWLLNQRLDLDFVREPEMDIELQLGNKEIHSFPIYQFCMPLHGSTFLIYKLKSGKETLLPEVKQLDYLWRIESASPDNDARDIAGNLRDIPEIQLAQILSPERLKNSAHLLV